MPMTSRTILSDISFSVTHVPDVFGYSIPQSIVGLCKPLKLASVVDENYFFLCLLIYFLGFIRYFI